MKKIVALIIVLMVSLALAGCSAERYGSGIDTGSAQIKVKDIFLDRNYIGRTVTLEGSIASQCGSNGCWFVLRDDTGQIFVNLAPNNMTIPPRMNKLAKVTGTVYPVQGELQVIAQGVEVR